ncbi:GFA family protein [Aspergillus saccharolyticus JOP 1030-1]|uniref:CENP-V/GFA domain-containing protein n=1 Tax=Aspergillus saccharolyticus JOP 1030-1 TaxID=1450539 RepID=A0A318Z4L8_9EURO|nr:hypothetical protein BP01DRAFT_385581 [Aspergillus saccharolyticus JOP 1030-1]PYH42261.1 hypothetical protein BP01DRAFT_385581 [Aspergillus saccharolyticus JOP 1030-1]
MATLLTGACLCQKITYRVDLPATDPLPQVILCHCTSCKRYTGSAFSSNIVVPRSALVYTTGSPKLYLGHSDRGPQVRRQFCADCGTPFTSQPGDADEIIIIKTGTLDEESRARCGQLGQEIWCRSKDEGGEDSEDASQSALIVSTN